MSSLLLLRLFHQSLPYLKSNIRELAADNTDKAAFEKVQLKLFFYQIWHWLYSCREFSMMMIKRVLAFIPKLQLQVSEFFKCIDGIGILKSSNRFCFLIEIGEPWAFRRFKLHIGQTNKEIQKLKWSKSVDIVAEQRLTVVLAEHSTFHVCAFS